jgi:hypothetical protein
MARIVTARTAALAGLAGWLLAGACLAADPAGPAGQPPRNTELRLVRSEDGLKFDAPGTLLLRGASAPTLTRVDDDTILLLVEAPDERGGSGRTRLAATRSADRGRTWTPLRAVRVQDRDGREVRPAAASLRSVHDGVELFFREPDSSSPQARERTRPARAFLASAESAEGLLYRIRNPRLFSLEHDRATSFVTFDHNDMTQILCAVESAADRPESRRAADPPQARMTLWAVSGLDRARRRANVIFDGASAIQSVVVDGRALRAYGHDEHGIVSFTSGSARRWQREEGVRVERAEQPAVVRLAGDAFLMVYVARVDKPSPDAPLVAPPPEGVDGWLRGATASSAIAAEGWTSAPGELLALVGADLLHDVASGAAQTADDGATADTKEAGEWTETGDGAAEGDGAIAQGEAPVESSDTGEVTQGADVADGPAEDGAAANDPATETRESPAALVPIPERRLPGPGPFGAPDDTDYPNEFGFPPKPDLIHRVDYIEYYKTLLDSTPDNAFLAYAEFMPDPHSKQQKLVEWPEPLDPFNDPDGESPYQPWDPESSPAYEASRIETAELMEKFRDATRHEGYAYGPRFSENRLVEGQQPLLLELLLPQLSSHRKLVKATMGYAWRAEDGRVSPQGMMDALETGLRGAQHMKRGATLIENLVSTAENAFLEENARRALAQGVISTEQDIAATLDILTRHDRNDRDPVSWVRGEYAFAMDITQALFKPDGPDGELRLDRAVADAVLSMDGTQDPQRRERMLSMTPEEVHESIEAFDGYYRELGELMRTGYPQARAEDLDAAAEKYIQRTPLTGSFLPALSRYHLLATRQETSRRATQLTYAVHLFHKKEGRWPATLDELPAEHGETMRIDPFSGRSFGYRVTDEGPRIYSASENGIDDGGIHSRRWGDTTEESGGSDDHVFWPPPPSAPR